MTCPVHESLRPHVADAADLYAVLVAQQQGTRNTYYSRLLATVALLAGGFILPGAAGMASFCLAAVAGLLTVAALIEFITRNLMLDAMTLHEVIRPRGLFDQLAYEADTEAREDG